MRRPKNLTALILAGLHLAFCAVFFAIYFSSNDPQRAIALVMLLPADPWIALLGDLIHSDAVCAVLVVVAGTAQWWVIGWVLGRISDKIRRRMSNNVTSLGAR
jgi:hypothetical protein